MFVVHEKDGKKITAADAFLFTCMCVLAVRVGACQDPSDFVCAWSVPRTGQSDVAPKIPIAQKRTSTWPVVRYDHMEEASKTRKPYTERGR